MRWVLFFFLFAVLPVWAQVSTETRSDLEPIVAEGEPRGDEWRAWRGGGPSFEQEVVMIVNQERWANGQLPPLKSVDLLDASSELHSDNMATRDFFAHCDPDTMTEAWDRMSDAGYSWNAAGENIAIGQADPTAVMTGWMASSGHRANILSTDFREIGVGYVLQASDQPGVRRDQDGNCIVDGTYNSPFFRYWTQNFGRRTNAFPLVIEREAHETDTTTVALYVYGPGNADEMRFRNDKGTWSGWMPFANETDWDLAPINGLREIDVEVRTTTNATYSASDTIVLMQPCVTFEQVEASIDIWPGSETVMDLVLWINNLCTL